MITNLIGCIVLELKGNNLDWEKIISSILKIEYLFYK